MIHRIPLLLVLVLHIYVIRIIATHLCFIGTRIYQCTDYRMSYYYHRHMDSRHSTVTHACMVSLFLSYGSPFILHVLLCHVTVFRLYDCFLLLIWIFPILDMRAVDMQYVESHIYCSRYIVPVILFLFPVILFPLYCFRFPLYCSMLSTELRSSYHVTRIMYCIYSCYIVYLTYQIIKLTWVWGDLMVD